MQTILKILFCSWGGHLDRCTTIGMDFQRMQAHFECHVCGAKWQEKLTAEVAARAARSKRNK